MALPLRLLNQMELSAHTGWHVSSIKAWTAQGMPREPNGLYDPHKCISWRRELDIKTAKKKSPDVGDLESERARVAKEQADKLELENAIARGEYVHIEVIAGVIEQIVAAIRPKLLGLSAFLTPRVVGCNKMSEVSAIIDEKSNEILLDLATVRARSVGKAGSADPEPDETVPSAATSYRQRVGGPKSKAVARKQRRNRSVVHGKG